MESRHDQRGGGALAPSAAALIFCAARYRNPISGMLQARSVVVLGDASYSIYLLHFSALIAVTRWSGSAVHGIAYDAAKLVLVMAAILLMSLMTYAVYENPARQWLRRLRRSQNLQSAAAGDPRRAAG